MPATTLPGDVNAHLAVPPVGAGPWPGVVVLHEAFGLNDDIRQQADRLAAAGYLALAPDLYSAGGACALPARDVPGGDVGPREGLRRHRGRPHVARRAARTARAGSA